MLILYIHNDGTGTVKTGNYEYSVCINQTYIDGGICKGHQRDLGWEHLVIKLAQESLEGRTKRKER